MFDRKDVLIGPVQKVMKENQLRRDVESAILNEMNVVSQGQLTTENKRIYTQVFDEVFPLVVAEDFKGDIQEVSKEKLGRYMDKSQSDTYNRGFKSGEAYKSGDAKTVVNNTMKHFSRGSGNKLAVKKLSGQAKVNASEETQIDELSKKTYDNYIDKSTKATNSPEYEKVEDDDVWKKNKKRFKGLERAHMLKYKTKSEETINELSKGTLGSYVKKAAKSAVAKGVSSDHFSKEATKETDKDRKRTLYSLADKDALKSDNRVKGIGQATDRLAKEETLSELSKEKLQNYVKKATTNLTNNAYNDDDKSSKRIQARNVAMKKIDSKKKLSEASFSKLNHYAYKAGEDSGNAFREVMNGDYKDTIKAQLRNSKRNKGKDLAIAKMDGKAKVNASEETISELSRATLGQYRYKAGDKMTRAHRSATDSPLRKGINKTIDGIGLATKKLNGRAKVNASEETINELSLNTLASYVKKKSKAPISDKNDKNIGTAIKKLKGGDTRSDGKPLRVGEEVVNELSTATVGRYITKATKSVKNHAYSSGRAKKMGEYDKENSKAYKRMDGIRTAVKKLTGAAQVKASPKSYPQWKADDETAQARKAAARERLDELSKAKLSKYIDKAENSARDIQDKSYSSMDAGTGQKLYNKYIQRYDNTNLAKSKVYGYGKAKVKANEETDAVNEVSGEKLRKYVKDSHKALAKAPDGAKMQKVRNRGKGIQLAQDKLDTYWHKDPNGKAKIGAGGKTEREAEQNKKSKTYEKGMDKDYYAAKGGF